MLGEQAFKLKADRQTEVNRRKLQLNDEQDKLTTKSAKNRNASDVAANQDEFSISPAKSQAVDKFKIIIKKTSPRNDANTL